jgi:hypothetical protein
MSLRYKPISAHERAISVAVFPHKNIGTKEHMLHVVVRYQHYLRLISCVDIGEHGFYIASHQLIDLKIHSSIQINSSISPFLF